MNKDVPPEAIIRQLVKENKRLRLEKAELKHKLDCKEQAIASFKQWQSRVADYKYSYWLNEGLKLASVQPDKNQVEALRVIFGNDATYKRWIKKCENAAQQIEKAGIRLNKTVMLNEN